MSNNDNARARHNDDARRWLELAKIAERDEQPDD
jgi:hypothetical protein